MRDFISILLILCVISIFGDMSFADDIEIKPLSQLIIQEKENVDLLILITNKSDRVISDVLNLSFNEGTISPDKQSITILPKDWHILKLKASLDDKNSYGKIISKYNKSSTEIEICRGIDLTAAKWTQTFTPRSFGMDIKIIDSISSDKWSYFNPPSIWDDNNIAWCKTEIVFPESMQNTNMKLILGAIDDMDITYLNGRKIGETDGWDLKREYTIPSEYIKKGEKNTLIIMVNNPSAGGGFTKSPYIIIPENIDLQSKANKTGKPINREKTGKIGNPQPIRPIHIENGILKYPEGNEVALWGVNYYPQSWYQFENMTKLNIDMKKTIRQDLDHMKLIGIEIIRVHVFDREISDGEGNIIPNIHLDLLDYMISEAGKHGIYMYLTPIAWWAGPNEVPGAFSQVTSKPGMMYVPKAKAAARNYLTQFMNHKNKYSGNAYKDEPCICFFEVMNEPSYFLYGDMTGTLYPAQGEKPEILANDKKILSELWNEWLGQHELDDLPEYFTFFRYELMRNYIKEMIGTIRSTGAKQPIAINYGLNGEDLIQAIADSECDAITMSAYPGGLTNHVDGKNLLPLMKQMGKNEMANIPYYGYAFDGRLDGKARTAYEFDADGTNTSSYMYPAIAASFRSGGFQIACQFQYDSIATAKWNTDWGTHWLNWLYTPAKTVSFMIAGEAFRNLPRELEYNDPVQELILAPMATSFKYNRSIYSSSDIFMHSRNANDWKPLRIPEKPKRIVGTGSSPFADYYGTGLYTIDQTDANTIRLRINPDVLQLGDCMNGSLSTPVAVLENNKHRFRLNIKGWDYSECAKIIDGKEIPVSETEGGWLVTPGEYIIRR